MYVIHLAHGFYLIWIFLHVCRHWIYWSVDVWKRTIHLDSNVKQEAQQFCVHVFFIPKWVKSFNCWELSAFWCVNINKLWLNHAVQWKCDNQKQKINFQIATHYNADDHTHIHLNLMSIFWSIAALVAHASGFNEIFSWICSVEFWIKVGSANRQCVNAIALDFLCLIWWTEFDIYVKIQQFEWVNPFLCMN